MAVDFPVMSVGYTLLFFRLDARSIGNRLAANDGRYFVYFPSLLIYYPVHIYKYILIYSIAYKYFDYFIL